MKIIAFNGSPRKNWNTAAMLQKALDGAASKGAEVELINLYDLDFKGCTSCFACKTKNSKSYGKCAMRDDLTPYLQKLEVADAVLLGSPIYFGNVTGEMRSLMERMLFPYLMYSKVNPPTLFPKKIKTGFIYTMNVPEQYLKAAKYDELFAGNERVFRMIFGGTVESIWSTDTYQFADYTKVVADSFDYEAKLKRHEEVFPQDCQKAYELGIRLTEEKERVE